MGTATLTKQQFEEITGRPLEAYAYKCHEASIALVQSGALGQSRVARGTCPGVGGQHSWVVLGDDCYDEEAHVIDPTLWSYVDEVEGIWEGPASTRPHLPFGKGHIFLWGMPQSGGGEPIQLEGLDPWAQRFLDVLGPLDEHGWRQLAHAPVEGWPSKEIITAMYAHPRLKGWIPIDIVGMATDLNPAGLYLRTEEGTV